MSVHQMETWRQNRQLRIERRIADEVTPDIYDEAMDAIYDAIDNGAAF